MADLYRNCFAPTSKQVFRCVLFKKNNKRPSILSTECDENGGRCISGNFLLILDELTQSGGKSTVYVHIRSLETLKRNIKIHALSSSDALVTDEHPLI